VPRLHSVKGFPVSPFPGRRQPAQCNESKEWLATVRLALRPLRQLFPAGVTMRFLMRFVLIDSRK